MFRHSGGTHRTCIISASDCPRQVSQNPCLAFHFKPNETQKIKKERRSQSGSSKNKKQNKKKKIGLSLMISEGAQNADHLVHFTSLGSHAGAWLHNIRSWRHDVTWRHCVKLRHSVAWRPQWHSLRPNRATSRKHHDVFMRCHQRWFGYHATCSTSSRLHPWTPKGPTPLEMLRFKN